MPTSSYRVVHSFGKKTDGARPASDITEIGGVLYGTTVLGGANCGSTGGCGTVFKIDSGAESVLYSFGSTLTDAVAPQAGLVSLKGTLYGTTAGGGANNAGTVFKVARDGKETVLHSFGGPGDGYNPYTTLIAVNGMLYGVTSQGGAYGAGTIFSITTAGKESLLHSFGEGKDGAHPYGTLTYLNGALYGTTIFGGTHGFFDVRGGVAFSQKIGSAYRVLYNFGKAGDANLPDTNLLPLNGMFYGTSQTGGTNGKGAFFRLSPAGKESVLHSFGSGIDGSWPSSDLVAVNGTIYGTTRCGGAYQGTNACIIPVFIPTKPGGTLYSMTTSGTENVLHSFGAGNDGHNPFSGVTNVNGVLYGTTLFGGARDAGTVYALMP